MKPCKQCGIIKPLDDFYINRQLRDGHVNTCKVCWTANSRANHARPEAKARKRGLQRLYRSKPEKKAMELAAERRWRTNAENRRRLTEKQRAYRQSRPEKYLAHRLVGYAVKKGALAKRPCEVCGSVAEAHHDDYNKPLEVRWLCRVHHVQAHLELRAA
jgi:hypothetical protein